MAGIFEDPGFMDLLGGTQPAPAPAPGLATAAPAASMAAAASAHSNTSVDPFDMPVTQEDGAPPWVAQGLVPLTETAEVPSLDDLAKATENTESPPPAEVTAALDAAAKMATPEQAEAMAVWLAKRLRDGMGELTGSIPITLKTLSCMLAMSEASPAFAVALRAQSSDHLAQAAAFNRLDPIHGEKPAALVRSQATALQTRLAKSSGGGKFPSFGGRLGKAKDIAEKKAREAALVAQEQARKAQTSVQHARQGDLFNQMQGGISSSMSRAGAVAGAVGGGVAAKAQAAKADLNASVAERKALTALANASVPEAKVMLEGAMTAYTAEGGETAGDSSHLTTVLAGAHGHAVNQDLIKWMISWLHDRLQVASTPLPPSVLVRFYVLNVLQSIANQGPPVCLQAMKSNSGFEATLTELSTLTAEPHPTEGDRPANAVRQGAAQLLAKLETAQGLQAPGGDSGLLNMFAAAPVVVASPGGTVHLGAVPTSNQVDLLGMGAATAAAAPAPAAEVNLLGMPPAGKGPEINLLG